MTLDILHVIYRISKNVWNIGVELPKNPILDATDSLYGS